MRNVTQGYTFQATANLSERELHSILEGGLISRYRIMKENHDLLTVIDLHCDLLLYLAASSQKEPHYHPEARCSLPQLKEGGVCLRL